MNRQSLGPDRGMVFPYEYPQPVAFWMKNTLIPLDIIFIAPGGRILRIEANTVPLSLEPVGSGEPVEAVLEIAGGRAPSSGWRQATRWSGASSCRRFAKLVRGVSGSASARSKKKVTRTP